MPKLPPWLGDVAVGLMAGGGGLLTNHFADRQARRSMAFAERMASTQAQRAVADFKAAGLNPALAYDRQAASPGGTQAPVGDFIGQGVSSAMAARQFRKQFEEQVSMNLAAKGKMADERDLIKQNQRVAASNEKLLEEEYEYNKSIRDKMRSRMDAENEALRNANRKSSVEAKYYEMVGPLGLAAQQLSGPIGAALGAAGLGVKALRQFIGGSSARGAARLRPTAPPTSSAAPRARSSGFDPVQDSLLRAMGRNVP